MVGVEPSEALLKTTSKVLGDRRVAAVVQIGLCRDDEAVAPAAQGLAEIALGLSLSIDRRRIDEVDVEFYCSVDNLSRGLLGVEFWAELISADSYLGRLEVRRADASAFDRSLLLLGMNVAPAYAG